MNTTWNKRIQSLIIQYETETVQMPLKVLISYFANEAWYKAREKLMDDVAQEMAVRLGKAKCGWQYTDIRVLDQILDTHIKPLITPP